MRLNKFLALATGMSRRAADKAITDKRVRVNGELADLGKPVSTEDDIQLDDVLVQAPLNHITIMLHKPVGYVCSRDGQGSNTIYDLLPAELQGLKPIGRLDKETSGLLLLTTDGDLAQQLSHPKHQKEKHYSVVLDRPLTPEDRTKIMGQGIDIGDERPSRFRVTPKGGKTYELVLIEGRNRQIRRTFEALGYQVVQLHRSRLAGYSLGNLKPADFLRLENSNTNN